GAGWLEREGRADEEDTAALLAKLDLQPGQTVADLGCGSGYYSRRMATAVGPEGTVFAVDIQPEMLRILRELAAREGISNIVPVQSQEDDPYLPEGEIDWILLVDVYHELQQPEPMLAAMREALAPGGRIALVEYRLEGDSARHIKLDHRMSPTQVLAEWEPAGFELVELWEGLPTQHLFIFQAAE
ncbi:MAG: class I SAM-dependent methyltransferase, partial [Thermoanaerobaculia bacterium]|nr:class I SAM-dependent methyltransferase [Thermoanaerobaculia bacterium]